MNKFLITLLLLGFGSIFLSESFIFQDSEIRTLNNESEFSYSLNHPDEVHLLPAMLLEVSGLTDISANKIACLQDEKGIIFIYNFLTKEVEKEILFADDADFEGLTRVGDVLYALSSEGTLYETKSTWKNPETKTYNLNLPSVDNEGLCYDEKNKRLLIAPKSRLGKGSEFKDAGAIFVFDLKKKKMETEPIFYFSVAAIYDFAATKGIECEQVQKKNGQINKHQSFRPSSVAVHPTTSDIYVISADDFGMVVFSQTGVIKDYFSFDKTIFSKAEGITFLEDGTMIITNEGVLNSATLLVFRKK